MAISDLLFVRGGRFDRPTVIEQQVTVTDAYGQLVATGDWITVFNAKAEILPFTGEISGFTVKPAPDFAVAPVTINIRYSASRAAVINNQMRVRHLTDNTVYRILYISNPETAQKILQLACQVAT